MKNKYTTFLNIKITNFIYLCLKVDINCLSYNLTSIWISYSHSCFAPLTIRFITPQLFSHNSEFLERYFSDKQYHERLNGAKFQ
jgi:hypothetical protein